MQMKPTIEIKETDSSRSPSADSARISRIEKIGWALIAAVAVVCVAVAASAPYRRARANRAAFDIPRWNLLADSEDFSSYNTLKRREYVMLVSGREAYIRLADLCGQSPSDALLLTREALNGDKDMTLLTAGSLAPLLIEQGLAPNDIKKLVALAQPSQADIDAFRAGALDPDAGRRLTINQLAVNLIERMTLIEPSQDDSHRTGVKRTTGADGQIEVTEVKGRYVPREGFDPLRRGSVRFDDVAVQADYYQRRFSEMTAPVSDGGAGRESRRAPFFIIPSGQRTASDSASSAVPPAID